MRRSGRSGETIPEGGWADHRGRQIGGDFLLIYEVDDPAGESGSIVFIRAGTHSELFGNQLRAKLGARGIPTLPPSPSRA